MLVSLIEHWYDCWLVQSVGSIGPGPGCRKEEGPEDGKVLGRE